MASCFFALLAVGHPVDPAGNVPADTILPTLDLWSGYLLAALIVLLAYQQWRLHRFRREATKREELFRIVAENAPDMIALVDAKGRRLYNSPAYEKVLGYSIEELAATSALEQIHPDDRFRVMEASREALSTGVGRSLQYRIRHKDGTWRTLESTASTIRNRHGVVEKLVIVNRNITERKRLEEQREQDSLHDPLTHLPNRHLFLNRLQHALLRSHQDRGHRYAVLFVDIDDFRELCQRISISAGDGVIIEAARRIQDCLEKSDTIARVTTKLPTGDVLLPRSGGDEFAILLDAIEDPIEAVRTANRIQAAFVEPFTVEGRPTAISVSIGIALNDPDQSAAEDLLVDADHALDRAKAQGKCHSQVYDQSIHSRAETRLKLEDELTRAIDGGEFPLSYQPIFNLDTRQIVGVEALLRWQHPEQGTVLPSQFIGVAEEMGLTVSIGRAVVRRACEEMRWLQAQRGVSPSLIMTVNLSPKQFVSPDLVKEIRSVLLETQLDPARLQVEIPECTVLSDPAASLDIFNRLKHLGIRISVGDFGTGQSSVTLLRRLPIDELKIDRVLVKTVLTDPASCDIAGLIVTVARKLKLRVVAEGVESGGQLDRLQRLGCELGQGYFFSPAVDLHTIKELIGRGH